MLWGKGLGVWASNNSKFGVITSAAVAHAGCQLSAGQHMGSGHVQGLCGWAQLLLLSSMPGAFTLQHLQKRDLLHEGLAAPDLVGHTGHEKEPQASGSRHSRLLQYAALRHAGWLQAACYNLAPC